MSYSFLSLDQFPKFYPLHFQHYEISLNVLMLLFFLFLASLPLAHHLFVATPFCIYVFRYFGLSIQSLTNGRRVTIPTVSFFFFFFSNSICVCSNLLTLPFLFLYLTFIFVEQFILNYLLLQNVTWICHWERRMQDNYRPFCLCMK